MIERESSQRTATRIVEMLRSSEDAIDASEIAADLGLHPNGVRTHLHRLEARGLVTGEKARGAVGRPPVLWSVTPRAIAESDLPHAGWAMARSLARAISPSKESLADVEEAGVAMSSELLSDLGPMAGSEPIEAALDALGFAPRRSQEGDRVTYCLTTCPYAEAVRENPAVVCTLHKGILRGVIAQLQPEAELTGFDARPPDTAGCEVELQMTPPRE